MCIPESISISKNKRKYIMSTIEVYNVFVVNTNDNVVFAMDQLYLSEAAAKEKMKSIGKLNVGWAKYCVKYSVNFPFLTNQNINSIGHMNVVFEEKF